MKLGTFLFVFCRTALTRRWLSKLQPQVKWIRSWAIAATIWPIRNWTKPWQWKSRCRIFLLEFKITLPSSFTSPGTRLLPATRRWINRSYTRLWQVIRMTGVFSRTFLVRAFHICSKMCLMDMSNVFSEEEGPKTQIVGQNVTLKEFVVLKDRSYQCNSGSAIKIEDRLTLKFSGLRTQAFVSKNRFDTRKYFGWVYERQILRLAYF